MTNALSDCSAICSAFHLISCQVNVREVWRGTIRSFALPDTYIIHAPITIDIDIKSFSNQYSTPTASRQPCRDPTITTTKATAKLLQHLSIQTKEVMVAMTSTTSKISNMAVKVHSSPTTTITKAVMAHSPMANRAAMAHLQQHHNTETKAVTITTSPNHTGEVHQTQAASTMLNLNLLMDKTNLPNNKTTSNNIPQRRMIPQILMATNKTLETLIIHKKGREGSWVRWQAA